MSNIQYADFFLLRVPRFPLSYLKNVEKFNDESLSNDFISSVLDDKEFMEALFYASPVLLEEFNKLRRGKIPDAKKNRKLFHSLLKYLTRSSSRSTPFGLFAGCVFGEIGTSSDLTINTDVPFKSRRLDMYFTGILVERLIALPYIKSQLKYRVNTSLYYRKEVIRYIEFNYKEFRKRYNLVSLNSNKYLDKILSIAEKGETIQAISLSICDQEIAYEEAAGFVFELIDAQVLVSCLEPSITGKDNLAKLSEELSQLDHCEAICADLDIINAILQNGEASILSLMQVEAILKKYLPEEHPFNNYIQADLYFNSKNVSLNERVINSIRDSVIPLWGISGTGNQPTRLQAFIKLYEERYGERELPMCNVLDPESGIGYGSSLGGNLDYAPLFDGIKFQQETAGSSIAMNKFDTWLLKRYIESVRDKVAGIVISEQEMQELSSISGNIPDSFFVIGNLIANSNEAIEQGDFKFCLNTFSGPSFGNILGRFCSGLPALSKKVVGAFNKQQEDNLDVIYAEIVHLPQNRTGNILIRPILSDYEIVFLANSDLDPSKQININDLVISIRDKEVILFSKQLNKRIIPRLTTAHNYNSTDNLDVYKFLCDLQYQGVQSGFDWNWGMLSYQDFLPRVTFRNIIVSRAQWRINSPEFPFLNNNSKNSTDYDSADYTFINNYLRDKNIPQYVTLLEGDNELYIDFKVKVLVDIFLEYLVKKKSAIICEFLFSQESNLVRNEENKSFANEIIFPFFSSNEQKKEKIAPLPVPANVKMSFPPGSEWIYYKIYCSSNSAENVLRNEVNKLIHEHRNLFTKWFFIRYADPEFHLRLRFHNNNKAMLQDIYPIMENMFAKAVDSGLITKIQVDTYHRELERYGYQHIEFTESLFYIDSEAVLSFIKVFRENYDESVRWQIVLRCLDMYMDDFGLTLEKKQQLMQGVSTSFYAEFAGDPAFGISLGNKYRENTQVIYSILNPANDDQNEITDIIDIFRCRTAGFNDMLQEYGIKRDRLVLDYWSYLPSYIHMFINRCFTINQRKYELLLYYFLEKYYTSALARNSKKTV